MESLHYRIAGPNDVTAMARLRALRSESLEYWEGRVEAYLSGRHHPQQAMAPRIGYIAVSGDSLAGFIAGHLTRRYGCDGELQWIDVVPERRRHGVASELLRLLAAWFREQNAGRICVDVDPANLAARNFYFRHGAERLNDHWLQWKDIRGVLPTDGIHAVLKDREYPPGDENAE